MKKTPEEQMMQEYLQEAQYLGEDGAMCIDARFTRLGAYRKMAKCWIEDCGYEDWKEYKDDCDFTPDSLSIAWFHLVKPEDKHKYADYVEWYVSIDKRSPYEVWCYWA